jgi:hypothetical protein
MRRKLSHRVPFDELQAKKSIGGLKNQLSTLKKELSKTQALKEKNKFTPHGIELVDNTLKIVT